MAGYIDSADNWALFSDEWDRELKAPRPIEYFKMAEANFLEGQFRGWSIEERDEKVRRLIGVIRDFHPASFEFSVSVDQYDTILRQISPRGINPRFLGCFYIVKAITAHFASLGKTVPIDFIFDDQDGVDASVALFFDFMKSRLPRASRNLIRSSPMFRSDQQFLPLQAADLFAWHLRRRHEGSDVSAELGSLLRDTTHLPCWLEDHSLLHFASYFATLPNIDKMQSKQHWRNLTKQIPAALAAGYLPPYGSRWKNSWRAFTKFFSRRFR